MPKREKFSGVDNAWRRMGEMENLMTITGILTFDEKLTYEELTERLESRLLRFERFKQSVSGRKRRFRRPYWETVEDFDIHNHVYEISLPEPSGKERFEKFVGTLMSRPLDERRPMWEVYLIQDVDEDGSSALAVRLNHSIGDGFALMYCMFGLVDDPSGIDFPIGGISTPDIPEAESDDPTTTLPDESEVTAAQQAKANGGSAVSADEDESVETLETDESPPSTESTESPPTVASDTAGDGSDLDADDENADDEKTDPREKMKPSSSFGPLGLAAKGAKTAWDLFTMDEDPETSLRGDLGATKRAAWTENIDLERIKTIGHAHDATVNDVLLAVTAGALRRLYEQRGESVEDLELRCTIPVNLKPMEDRDESLGNYFGLVWVPIPVGEENLQDRIDIIHERMDAHKAGMEAFIMYQLIRLGGWVPEIVQSKVMDIFEGSATGIVTNVPGPLDTVEFAGKEITDMIFWVPQGNGQGLGISLISYNSGIRVGVTGDANLIPEPRDLTAAFETEVDILLAELDPEAN